MVPCHLMQTFMWGVRVQLQNQSGGARLRRQNAD